MTEWQNIANTIKKDEYLPLKRSILDITRIENGKSQANGLPESTETRYKSEAK